jgi:acyl-CoA dehydrogenase
LREEQKDPDERLREEQRKQMSGALAGGVFESGTAADDDAAELRQLVDDLGRRSFDARVGHRGLPEQFDAALWANLEDTGLSRLTSTPDLGAGPAELAIVLSGLGRHAAAVPLAETDLLAGWLGATAGVELPGSGPLTVAIGDADLTADRLTGTVADVPWVRASAAVLLAVRTGDGLRVAAVPVADLQVTDGHNLAGEPRDTVGFDLPVESWQTTDAAVVTELVRRGAWARCVQTIGALDAAAEQSVAYTRERVQFGRSLSKFQSVQHSLAAMAGEIERARAAATLAVAAAADHGFNSPEADYAVTVAKVVLGRVVPTVATIAHQLHGAIGVTIEHPLWLATNRAHSWMDEFGSTGHYARRLGRAALAEARDGVDPWDVLIGNIGGNWG